jgi:AcrR family transcriptional regulator
MSFVSADCPSEKPATRREARRRSRREAILEVAARSFLEQGYDGTTMSAIAGILGGSKGTLWSYFPSKDVLFAAVIDQATAAFREQLLLILNPHDEVTIALHRFCDEFLRKIISPEAIALYRLVMGEASRFPEVGRIFHERAPNQTRILLADYLSAAMGRGQLRRDDPLRAARELIGLCMCGSHGERLLGLVPTAYDDAVAAEAEQAASVFLRAYAV